MKIFKKVLALILAVSMVVSLAACGIEEGAFKGELFDLYSDDGEALFRIIRPNNADPEVSKLGAKLRNTIKDNLNLDIEYKPDTMKKVDGIYGVLLIDQRQKSYLRKSPKTAKHMNLTT